MASELKLLSPNGSTSSILVIVPGAVRDLRVARETAESEEVRTYLVQSSAPNVWNINEHVERLMHDLSGERIKRATIIGVDSGASVAQAFAVRHPKSCRRLILVNPTTRVSPSVFDRAIDSVERFLPLGLPLRRLSKAFDSRPILHRIRCPMLVLSSPEASLFQLSQAEEIARRTPTAWHRKLKNPYHTDAGELSGELMQFVEEFLKVSVKQPQKGSDYEKSEKLVARR